MISQNLQTIAAILGVTYCSLSLADEFATGHCRTVTIISAKTQKEHDVGTLPLFSINRGIYLVDVRHDLVPSKKKPTGDDYVNFGTAMWDCRTYDNLRTNVRTKAYSKLAGREAPWTSDSGLFLGYELDGPEIVVRLVERKEPGTSHEWTEEIIKSDKHSSEVHLRVAKGHFEGWYLSFGKAEKIDKKTVWKDSRTPPRMGEMPPHIRYPATLVKEPDEMSVLRTIGYYPEGR